MKEFLKRNIMICIWILVFIFMLFTKKISGFQAIRATIIFLWSLCYIIYYCCKVKTDIDAKWFIKIKRIVLDFLLFIHFSLLIRCLNIFNIFDSGSIKILEDSLVVFFVLFIFLRMILLLLSIRFRTIIFLLVGMFIVGAFSADWWTGIALVVAAGIALCSEDVLLLFEKDKDLTEEEREGIKKNYLISRLSYL